MTHRTCGLVLVLLCAASSAWAKPTPNPRTAPDPRKGERLDGREAPKDPNRYALALPRLVLTVPRVAARAAFYPVVKTVGFVEERKIYKRTISVLTTDDGLIGVRPDLSYDSTFGIAAGVRYFDERSLGRNSLIQLRVRAASQDKYMAEARLRAPDGLVELSALFDKRPDALFGGFHGETLRDLEDAGLHRVRYGYERGRVRLQHELTIVGPLSYRVRGDLDVREYDAGQTRRDDPTLPEVFDPMSVPGYEEGMRVLRPGAEIVLDTRSNIRHGTGFLGSVEGSYTHGIEGDPSRHVTSAADFRFVLGLQDRAVILRTRAGMVEATGDAPVPFEELLSPTGNEGIRGIPNGERRGASELLGSVEYRWLLAPRLDGFVFVDHGGAFEERFEGLAWDRLEPAVGGGFRILRHMRPYWNAPTVGGLQVAWSPDHGARFILSVGI